MIIFINIFIFLFGLIIGSFLNCVIYRLALPNFSFWKNLGGLKNRSYCPHCRQTLRWYDLIPVLSYVILKAKCRYCKKKISWQYPLVEISTGLIFLLIFLPTRDLAQRDNFLNLSFLLIISCFLIVIFVYDLKHYIIPDKIVLPAIAVVALYRLFEVFGFRVLDLFRMQPFGESLVSLDPGGLGFGILKPFIFYLISAIAAAGFFLLIFLVSKGKWLGFGDIKLAFFMGIFLGFPKIIVALFLAFFFGGIIGIGLIIFKNKNLKSEIPFAPFLITGTFLALFWGQNLINWYLSFII